jgi:hypothetical protein
MMKPIDLIDYCGTCARWHENLAFRKLASALAELADGHGLHHWMPDVVKEFDYTEFRNALDFLTKKENWFVCRKGCKAGDSNPYCEIRKCCQEHELDICFDCSEFPCDKVKGNTEIIERAKEYRKLGKEEWLCQQIEKAKKGYEHHTEKYYRIWVGKHPPK